MNIFILDSNPELCAQYHCDKHVVKMITETAQLLCSAYYYTGESDLSPYRLAHHNHPCAIWVRQSSANWWWLWWLGYFLYEEYRYRYGNRMHKAGEVIKGLKFAPPSLPEVDMTFPALAMPSYCKTNDPIESYRNYYRGEKQHLMQYTKREIPYWL